MGSVLIKISPFLFETKNNCLGEVRKSYIKAKDTLEFFTVVKKNGDSPFILDTFIKTVFIK